MSFDDDILFEPNLILLGVFGHSNQLSEDELHTNILHPLLAEFERLPDRIMLPSDGNTSIFLQDWAEQLHIKTQVFQADWQRNGRIAQILRDDRIQKECTHALVFLSSRSDRMEKFAEKIAKKGKRVFTSSSRSPIEMAEICLEMPPPPPVSTPARKSGKGTMMTWLKCQTTTTH